MIKYSHVSLAIVCETAEDAAAITSHLGVQPSRVRKSVSHSWSKEEGHAEALSHTWMLDSPKSHDQADTPERLWELANLIEPFAERLRTLPARHQPWVDIIYHNTPQYPHGVKGEFHLLMLPPDLMRRYCAFNLMITYEVFWFDHPDWVRPTPPT
jgi:hypothetical protein